MDPHRRGWLAIALLVALALILPALLWLIGMVLSRWVPVAVLIGILFIATIIIAWKNGIDRKP
ncbi:hypothetical protein [Pseudoramibacter faecis]|uniref:hypothetical protein n=1 Tax=Pseudoramibacter faecis TaxID=3108534 RepID=UPI002E79BD92|nr:hypothetical protein [Pseudoramibacter sp. HA2172]